MEAEKCLYCRLNSGAPESEHFIRILESREVCVYLHRDQTLPGRVVVATARHYGDITDLPAGTHIAFFRTMRRFARAIKSVYPATAKINLALCGNAPEARHPHMHVLPRRPGDRRWPDFFLDYQPPYWPDHDPRYQEAIQALLAAAGD